MLQSQVSPPLLGSGAVLPISDALPGGFLGVVKSVSADGRTIGLEAGGLSDAFDYYEISVPDFSVGVDGATGGGPIGPQAQSQQETSPAAPPGQGRVRGDRGNRPPGPTPPGAASAESGGLVKPSAFTTSAESTSAALAALEGPKADCEKSLDAEVTFSPSVQLAGRFNTKVDKYSLLGADIPVSASVDMALTATVTGAATVETTADLTCEINLLKITHQLSLVPVPMSVTITPKTVFTINGQVEVSNLGLTATGGVRLAGTMSFKNGTSFSGNTIMSATPLMPTVTAKGLIDLKVGGELLLGPGVATTEAGVVAGLSGDFYPLDANAKLSMCSEITAAFTRNVDLTVKAWIGKWSASEKITLDFLDGKSNYSGSPWDLPKGCTNLPPPESPTSLLGPGVTKVNDSTVGTPEQWGHVEGFVPGTKTWVLSTGLISDALGAPGDFASTNLGGEGDAELTTLAGHPTHDAASYNVTLVPAGSTLHVKYVFASEEYPEYVGSTFNDVMAVRVNGINCATVPGSTDAVSVNTINENTNSAYYVDNSTGVAGYSTSMDGLTVPLTCSVPVTPGQAVTVQIVVADTSDHVYDSAVALIDGGIWTD
ncbi:MAG: choice-of-anchor L domain-containing protein [Pseudonocardiaceae bacterium]